MAACRRQVVYRFAQGATAPAALKVVVSPLRAMNIKSALRDLLSVPYGMISILIIGLLRSSPKEETHSLGQSPICLFFLGRKPGCEGFIQTGTFYNLKALYNNPRAGGASVE